MSPVEVLLEPDQSVNFTRMHLLFGMPLICMHPKNPGYPLFFPGSRVIKVIIKPSRTPVYPHIRQTPDM